ncbi:MAG TPA: efflux RND transporter periplasmic adaptor subunit [bacterium]|nr:efflux RND transporter periplasmic adaptor subunit [bacterium]
MKKICAVALFLLLAACNGKKDTNEIVLTGSVESDTVRIASLVPGRLTEVNAVEGAKVKQGAVLARIDTADLELQLRQADTGVRAASARLALVRKGARSEDLATAKELVNQAEIAADKFEREYQRLSRLKEAGSVTDKDLDDMMTQRDRAKSQVEQAKKQYEKAQNGAQKEEIDAAIAAYDQARSTIDILKKKIADCTVYAPRDGTVLHRLAEPGEVIGAGSSIAVISDLATVKITAFVPERELGLVKLGMQATVRVDSFPDKPLSATVSRIADVAEFTPKTIQTQEERVKTVYRIELTADNGAGIFKPGMPVDVVFVREQ